MLNNYTCLLYVAANLLSGPEMFGSYTDIPPRKKKHKPSSNHGKPQGSPPVNNEPGNQLNA